MEIGGLIWACIVIMITHAAIYRKGMFSEKNIVSLAKYIVSIKKMKEKKKKWQKK
jgi:hypothetical protein